MASPGSTTGTDSLGDSSGNLASTDTNGGSGLTSPAPAGKAVGVIGNGSNAQMYSSPPGLVTPSPPGAPSLPTATITAGTEHHIPGGDVSCTNYGLSRSAPAAESLTIIRQEIGRISSEEEGINVKCPWCREPFKDPKVLACFHTFCKPCLESFLESPGKILCPQCTAETQLCADLGVDSLLSDYGLSNLIDKQNELLGAGSGSTENGFSGNSGGSPSSSSSPGLDRLSGSSPGLGSSPGSSSATCTGCKSKESVAVAHCQDCANFLCANCVMAHQYMHCFEGHRVRDLNEFDKRSLRLLMAAGSDKPVSCLNHRSESVKYYCFTCNIPICAECTTTEHMRGLHQFEAIQEIAEKQLEMMQSLLSDARVKHQNLSQSFGILENAMQRLTVSYVKAQTDVNETAGFLAQLVEEQRIQAIRDLENAVSSKTVTLNILEKKVQQTTDKLQHTIEFMDRLLKYASPTEALVFKKLLETRLQVILNYQTDVQNLNVQCDLEFVPSNGQTMRSSVANAFGFVRTGSGPDSVPTMKLSTSSAPSALPPTPIGRPPSRHRQTSAGLSPGSLGLVTNVPNGAHPAAHAFSDSNLLQAKQDFGGSSNSLGPYSTVSEPQQALGAPYPYKEWSSGSDVMGVQSAAAVAAAISGQMGTDGFGAPFGSSPEQVVELSSRIAGLFPPRSQIKRHKMIYHCKFGEFGVMEGQFTEPSGVAVNAQNDIIVADTNNHRIQIFDKEGRFKFQFGECGKRDGQLLYPNRVTVNRLTGDIVVTERSPTHQIQVYNQYGQFLRKFGANILQHPRGVTVDCKGRIVVIECKVMRVIIFDMYGNVLQKFSCSRYLEFPNGVCTNEKQEIFISDNRAHCVKVFNYEGQFLRQIGGEGVTNYPIGVGINQMGEVVVADNHNNFNLSLFHQEGTLVNALESKVKHAQCFDVCLLDEGTVVLASKDYRLYLYRYMQSPFPSLA